MFRVSLLGHSNVPREPLEAFGCEVRTYRSPGSHASTFDDNPTFRPALGWQHELSIVFLGSNDVKPDVEVFQITENIKHVVHKLEQSAEKVAIVLLEPRIIKNPAPGKPDQKTYNKVLKAVNRKLQRDLRGHDFINLTGPYFRNHLGPDGTHWNAAGKARVRGTLRKYIEKQHHKDWRRGWLR